MNTLQKFAAKIRVELQNIVRTMQPNGSILIAMGNKIIYEHLFGYEDIQDKLATTSQTQYLIGSITKQFTAVALLNALYRNAEGSEIPGKQSEKNIKDALQKSIAYYLSKNHDIWAGSMPEWANVVTVHQLLVHSSGIANYTSLPEFEKQKSPLASDLVGFFKNHPLEFNPGTQFSYNNSGYFLLGIIMQAFTKQPLDTYMHNAFFKLLNMKSTYLATAGTVIELKKSDPRFRHLARGYTFDLASPTPDITEVSNYALMQMPGGGGSLISNAADLLKWNHALFTDKIIPKFLRELILFPHIETEKPNEYYGYGIEIKGSKSFKYYLHRGGIPGFHSVLMFIPHLSMSIIILSNVLGNRDSLKSEMEIIKSNLLPTLSEKEKAQKMDEILEQKFPNINLNNKKYCLTSLEKSIISMLESQ